MNLQDERLDKPIAPSTFIGHKIATDGSEESIDALLYEYLLAGNGVFLRARRKEFTVSLPLCSREVRGLRDAEVGIEWNKPNIESSVWKEILDDARGRHLSSKFKEDVYLILWNELSKCWRWRSAGRNSNWAMTIADDALPEYGEACIELHTHPPGALHFSKADDRDESGKFRIFAILIDVHDKPKIRFRCGIYDHLVPIPAAWVGALPDGIVDLNEIDALVEMMS